MKHCLLTKNGLAAISYPSGKVLCSYVLIQVHRTLNYILLLHDKYGKWVDLGQLG